MLVFIYRLGRLVGLLRLENTAALFHHSRVVMVMSGGTRFSTVSQRNKYRNLHQPKNKPRVRAKSDVLRNEKQTCFYFLLSFSPFSKMCISTLCETEIYISMAILIWRWSLFPRYLMPPIIFNNSTHIYSHYIYINEKSVERKITTNCIVVQE